jgi:hypothetical protein
MSYLKILPDLFRGTDKLFQLAPEGNARPIMMVNIVILGIIYGLSNLYGTLQLTPDLPISGKYALLTPLLFSVFGIVTMFAALCGFCLIYWAAAKAFGGPGGLGCVLDLIGLAAVPFWFLAPLINYTLRYSQAETTPLYLLVPIVLVFIWSFKLIRQSMVAGQGIAEGKATLAVACMWIFSVSAIYVFLP